MNHVCCGGRDRRARGRSGTPQGPQRATGGAERAGRSPRLGGPEEYKRSTRSPRPSAGMRPNALQPEAVEWMSLLDVTGRQATMTVEATYVEI